MKPETLLTVAMFVFSQIATASGVYAAIRSDMRELQVRVSYLEKAQDRADYSPRQKGQQQ